MTEKPLPVNSAQPDLTRIGAVLAGITILVGLYLTHLHGYLLFHSLSEIFSIVVACGVFMLAWNSRRYLDNAYLLFIGIGYLFVAAIDTLHTLSYDGMGVFPGEGPDLPTQLWLAARYLQSVTLLAAPLFLRARPRSALIWLAYFAITGLLVGSILVWDIFPVAYVEGQGLTPFKIVSEYVISAILVAATLLLWRNRRAFDNEVVALLAASFVTTALSELAFTLYVGVYDLFNLVGHLLKIVAVYLLYLAIVKTGLVRPYSLLFRNLKRAEGRYRALFDEAPVMYVTLARSPGGLVITGCNDLFLSTLGYEKSQVIGRHIDDFCMGTCQGKLATSEQPEQERQLITSTGQIVDVLLRLSEEPSHNGGEAEFRAAFTNITQRQRARQAEREERAMAEALADIAATLNSTLELDSVLDRILDHVEQIVPHDATNIMLLEGGTARVVRHHGYDVSAWPLLENFRLNLAETPILARVAETRMPVLVPDVREEPGWVKAEHGEWIRCYAAAPICQEDKVLGFVSVDSRTPHAFSTRDAARLMAFASSAATALRNAQLYQQAEEARRLAERADRLKLHFLAMVSHELRTPLTSIQGFASTLLAPDVTWSPEDQTDFIQTIYEEADKLGELISQLLDLSRIESGKLSIAPQPQQLDDIIREASAQLQMLANEHHIRVNLAPDLPPVMADRRRVTQVLANLVHNAGKYAPNGTDIGIDAWLQGDRVAVSVSDEGPGIPVEQHDRIFEPFARLHEDDGTTPGSGLGLPICKGIVEAHGGAIWVTDGSPAGTTVTFTLPRA